MVVTAPGQGPREFKGLKNAKAGFEKLTSFGFTSNATKQTLFYLANLKLTNEAGLSTAGPAPSCPATQRFAEA